MVSAIECPACLWCNQKISLVDFKDFRFESNMIGRTFVRNTNFHIFDFHINNDVFVRWVLHIDANLEPFIFYGVKFNGHSMCKIGSRISGFCCFVDWK